MLPTYVGFLYGTYKLKLAKRWFSGKPKNYVRGIILQKKRKCLTSPHKGKYSKK
jgi:hypothetical protein